MRYGFILFFSTWLFFPAAAIQAKENIPFVMFGPNIVEDKTEVLSGLQPFIDWLNQRLPFQLAPYFFKKRENMNSFMNSHKVGFIMLDMSYYLEQRKKYGLVPMLKPVVKNRSDYQIVIIAPKKSNLKSLANLKNKKVSLSSRYSGTHEFYYRVAFRRKINPRKDLHLVYTKNSYAAMIDVLNQNSHAALVWRKDFEAICELNPLARRDLTVAYRSNIFPYHPLVYVRKNVTPEQSRLLTAALLKQAASAEGKQLLLAFRYEGWQQADPKEFIPLIQAYSNSRVKK